MKTALNGRLCVSYGLKQVLVVQFPSHIKFGQVICFLKETMQIPLNKIHKVILHFTIYTELSEHVLLESNQQECLLIFLKFCPFSLKPHKDARIHLAKVGWKTWPQVGIYNPNWVASAVLLSFLSQILWLGTPIEGRVDGDPLYTILNKITTYHFLVFFL